jgi:hypothetical protein
MKYQIILSGLQFPEGPVFDFNGNLWFVEIKAEILPAGMVRN